MNKSEIKTKKKGAAGKLPASDCPKRKMLYDNKEISAVYKVNNIVDVISKKTYLTKKKSYYVGRCPLHKEGEASFVVDPQTQRFQCLGCGRGGNVFSFVMYYENCSFEEAVSLLAKNAGVEITKQETLQNAQSEAERILQMNESACEYYQQLATNHPVFTSYVYETRGLDVESVKEHRLGMSPSYGDSLYRHLKKMGYTAKEMMAAGLVGYNKLDHTHYDKFWDRIIFPIRNVNDEIVGFGARALGDKTPKYLNSQETLVYDKSHELYGLNIAQHQRKSLVLCEGYMDVISMHRAGFKTAVASLGTALTFSQAKKMLDYTNTVFVAYDSDAPGVKAAARAIPILEAVGLKTYVISTAPFKDLDEMLKDESGREELKSRFRSAQTGTAFLLNNSIKNSNEEIDYKDIVNILMNVR